WVGVGHGAQPLESLRQFAQRLATEHFSGLRAWLSGRSV
ncbi:HAD family hydrolase, partial [Pseudomonas syringae]